MKLIYEKKIGKYSFQTYAASTEKPTVFSISPLCQAHQIHSNLIAKANPNQLAEADGLTCENRFHYPLAIKTADCLPIAIIGEKGYALLHAGWKGLRGEIIKKPEVTHLIPKLFFIGPHIQQNSYEVGEEFRTSFSDYPEAFQLFGASLHFSLLAVAKAQIKHHYPMATIEWSSLDTFREQHLHSYRRNQTPWRNWNILR